MFNLKEFIFMGFIWKEEDMLKMDSMILNLKNFSLHYLFYTLLLKIIRKKVKMKEDLHLIVAQFINIPKELINTSFSELTFLVKILIPVNGNLKELLYYAKLNETLYLYLFFNYLYFSINTQKIFISYII